MALDEFDFIYFRIDLHTFASIYAFVQRYAFFIGYSE